MYAQLLQCSPCDIENEKALTDLLWWHVRLLFSPSTRAFLNTQATYILGTLLTKKGMQIIVCHMNGASLN